MCVCGSVRALPRLKHSLLGGTKCCECVHWVPLLWTVLRSSNPLNHWARAISPQGSVQAWLWGHWRHLVPALPAVSWMRPGACLNPLSHLLRATTLTERGTRKTWLALMSPICDFETVLWPLWASHNLLLPYKMGLKIARLKTSSDCWWDISYPSPAHGISGGILTLSIYLVRGIFQAWQGPHHHPGNNVLSVLFCFFLSKLLLILLESSQVFPPPNDFSWHPRLMVPYCIPLAIEALLFTFATALRELKSQFPPLRCSQTDAPYSLIIGLFWNVPSRVANTWLGT